MFSDSITEYEIKKNKKLEKSSKERIVVCKGLSKLDNYLLRKTQSIINKITSEIERESGWEYFDRNFIFLSDFYLSDGDIKFTENKVPINFLVPELNDRELAFVIKYKPLLERLKKLEQKKRSYYNKALVKSSRELIVEQPKYTIFNGDFIKNWMDKETERFMKKYGSKGVERLVNNLNFIADGTDQDRAFSDLMKQNISSSYKKELLKWASSYSLKGYQLLERFVNLKDRIVEEDTYSKTFMYNSDIIPTYKNK